MALLYDNSLVRNNSIITVPSNGRIEPLECLSGSPNTSMGRVYQPDGADIMFDSSDMFHVDNSTPGVIRIELETGYSILSNHQGVYTCAIPDENDVMQYIYFALYRPTYDCKLSYTSNHLLPSILANTVHFYSFYSNA